MEYGGHIIYLRGQLSVTMLPGIFTRGPVRTRYFSFSGLPRSGLCTHRIIRVGLFVRIMTSV
jgi:hypothetical protein